MTETHTDTTPKPLRSQADLYADVRADTNDIDGIARFVETVARLDAHPSDFTVAIGARRDGATVSHVKTVAFRGFDEDALARLCGPGDYKLTLKNAQGRIVTNCEVTIDGRGSDQPGYRPSSPWDDKPPTSAEPSRLERMIETLAEQVQQLASAARTTPAVPQSHATTLAEIAQVMQAMRPQGGGVGVSEIVGAITALVPLIAGKASPIKDIMEGIRMVQEMSGGGGGGDGDGELAGLIRQVLTSMAAMPKQPAPPQYAQPGRAPRPMPTHRAAPPRATRQRATTAPTPEAINATATAQAAQPPQPAPPPQLPMTSDAISGAILFAALNGIRASSLAPAVIDLIGETPSNTFAQPVPGEHDEEGIALWLLHGRGEDARAMLAPFTGFIHELAGAMVEELSDDDDDDFDELDELDDDEDNGPEHERQADTSGGYTGLDDDGNPRAGHMPPTPVSPKETL